MLLMIFTILGLFLYILGILFEIYFDRNIMYLDQSTLRHQGQNRAFEAGTYKKIKNFNIILNYPGVDSYQTIVVDDMIISLWFQCTKLSRIGIVDK